MMDWHVCLLTALLPLVNTEVGEVPSARGSPFPVQVFEGDDVLITCVVRSIGSSTVLWKREETTSNASTRWKILTAGHNRVTQDTRIQVIHDDGGDVWVLAIKNANMSDAGLYTCEVNSKPIVQTFHSLSVLPRVMTPPLQNATVSPVDGANDKPLNHNYTECCVALNVSQSCLGFCNIQSILDGTTGQDPEHCENDFPAIVRCMADGRNHVPCCVDEKVPDICQDVCRGEYTMITDNIKTHFSCAVYTEETLACIVEGIEILPSMPLNVQVTPLTDRSFGVEWTPPFKNSETVTEYTINVTMLRSFDPSSVSWSPSDGDNSSVSIVTPHRVQVNVKVSDNQSNDVVIKDLVPFTMYEISIVAKNKHGSSLPTNTVRALTLVPGQIRSQVPKKVPELPDTKQCCVEKGVTHDKCLNKLCSPSDITSLETADLMICAPWAGKTFSCLANGKDHTPCCKTRGLPDVCLDLCSGNVSQLNFAYFKCIKFIPTLRDCLMDGYGVLPSAPLRVRVSNIDIDFAIVNWDTPKMLGSTVIHYNVYYRPLESPDYAVVYEVEPPHILGNLTSSTLYEVFVAANNVHGTGDSSQRVLFSTESKVFQAKLETDTKGYNLTACCQSAGVSQTCMALCSYDAKMSNLKTLAGVCSNELAKLVKCGAGGRNHSPCCARRGVPGSCLPICSGVVTQSLVASAATCIPYIGNIVLCYEEGTNNIPGPVSELHAVSVTNSEITLVWEPPKDGANATDYVIYYKKVDKTSVHETLLRLDNQKNTTKTVETLSNLEKGALYNVFVSARNEHGTSLPSSILLINVTKTELGDEGLSAVTSPPHSLAVSVHGAQYVTIAWQPPEFSHPAEQLVYRVFYKASSSQSYKASETSITSLTLDNLSPNTQYIIYVTAISKRGQSLPSETLIAWTDPAYPAFVEPPTVRPINLVVEGSSMTILCIAMGTPMPTVSLYISGRLVRQEVTRHMVTVIFNVTRDMNHISCYADNGYGTPMEARRRIIISYKPHITATGITMASQGDTVTLECSVEAHPDPQMIFWRDHEKRQPVIQDQKYSINIAKSKDEEDKWIMQLTIKSITESEGGDYFCHAENAFGNATQPVSVRLRNIPNVNNVTQCCKEQNVSNACQDACSFYLDIDAVIDKPECIGDFGKLMKCAADGSDHRTCCAQNGVDRTCLDWCRGEPLSNQDSKLCLVQHTKRIITCFKGGRERLPGPPQNVQIERIDDHSVLVKWALPVKNPHTAEMYRVFWKPAASNLPASKSDSKVTSLRVTGLKEGLPYEFSVKAINVRGASLPTEPLKFSTDEKYITSEASIGEEHSQYGVAMGLMFTVIFLVAIVCAAVWFVRNKNLLGHKSTGGNAFENPSYLREVNMDHIQPDANTSSGMSQSGWKQEHLHVPSSTEVAPSIYEELKLGHDGAGFKRLKP